MSGQASHPVLVVEDDPVLRGMLAAGLRRKALAVDESADAREAIALLREKRYAVVLVDLMLPGDLDGFAVLDAIDRTRPEGSPVVLVVTGAGRQMLERLDAKRIHAVVRKPFDPEEITSVVAACTEIRARSLFGTLAATVISATPLLAMLAS